MANYMEMLEAEYEENYVSFEEMVKGEAENVAYDMVEPEIEVKGEGSAVYAVVTGWEDEEKTELVSHTVDIVESDVCVGGWDEPYYETAYQVRVDYEVVW